MSLVVRLAWRNVWRNPRRTALTIAETVFAVVLTVASVALSTGTHVKMIEDSVALGSSHVQIYGPGYLERRTLEHYVEYDDAMTGLWVAVDAGMEFARSISEEVQLRNRFVAPSLQLLLLTLLGLFYEHFRRRSAREMEYSKNLRARSERQFRAVFDEASVGIVLVDPDGQVVGVNRFSEAFLPLRVGDRSTADSKRTAVPSPSRLRRGQWSDSRRDSTNWRWRARVGERLALLRPRR